MASRILNLGAALGLIGSLGTSVAGAQSVKVTVAAVPNPIAAGGCARIWADVRDSLNRQLTFENGTALQWSSYDYTSSNGTDFEWRSAPSGEFELCAKAGVASASTDVVATIKGMTHSGATQLLVASSAAAPPQTATAAPTAPPVAPQPTAAAVPAQPNVAPPVYGPPAQASAPPAQTAPPAQAYAPPAAASQPAPAAAPPQQAQAQPVKSAGGFFKKIGSHLKQRAAEVKAETAQNLTAAATQVLDTTFQTGSKLVASTVAEASNTARMSIGGVGRQLMLAPQRGGTNSDNLALAIASGRAILLEMRFAPNSEVLETTGRELVVRVAAELKQAMATNPTAQFVIEGHVEAGPNAQVLSELRAGAVKAALFNNGVDARRLIALGYGDTRPLEQGGAPVARIEIARVK